MALLSLGAGLLAGCTTSAPTRTTADAAWVRQVFAQPQDPHRLMATYLLSSGDQLDLRLRLEPLTPALVAPGDAFVLQPGHRVAVRFIQVAGLDVTQGVRADGMISLPYVGDVPATGLTVAELTAKLKGLYRAHLKFPELYVLVDDPAPRAGNADELSVLLQGETIEVRVRPDGFASFPLLADMEVAGRSVPVVGRAVADAYRRVHPRILADLSLVEAAGIYIYVFGRVDRPGAFEITRPVTVLQALSLAGSAVPGAVLDSVVVLRKQGDAVAAKRLNLTGLGEGKHPPFYLGPDDMVYVPESAVSRTSELVKDLAEIVMFRGWNVSLRWDDLDNE